MPTGSGFRSGARRVCFWVGLASVSLTDWKNREFISHEDFASRHKRVCIVPSAGAFSVGFALRNGISMLTHYGIANLPGI